MNLDKINEWLEKHDYSCTVEAGKEFQYLTREDGETIIISEETPKDSDLKKVCKQFGVELNEDNVRVFCFLHELGHYNTIEYYSLWSILVHNILMLIIPNVKMFDKLSEYIHHRFDFELGATEWACEFMLEHPRLTNQLKYII